MYVTFCSDVTTEILLPSKYIINYLHYNGDHISIQDQDNLHISQCYYTCILASPMNPMQ
jgi:hypothetical protein